MRNSVRFRSIVTRLVLICATIAFFVPLQGLIWVGLDYPFIFYLAAIGFGGLILCLACLAWITNGKSRLRYICATVFFLSIAVFSSVLLLAASPTIKLIAIVLGIITLIVSGSIYLVNFPAIRPFEQAQELKQLDTPKADPFYAEQVKADKVKGQRLLTSQKDHGNHG